MLGPVGGEEADIISCPKREVEEGGMDSVVLDKSRCGLDGLIEVGAAGKFERESGQGKIRVGFKSCGEGYPTII